MMELVLTEIGMLLAFITGFILGKTNSKSNTAVGRIKMTKTEKKNTKAIEDEIKKRNSDFQITLDNIDNYDGTGANQKKYSN